MTIRIGRGERAALHGELLTWYRQEARDLPWRRTRDPYGIWLSEIMLQQTRVETVVAYYERWITALPTVEALAAADEETVLKLWEGLGYYRRARNLHKAAKVVVTERGGELPTDAAGWLTLPGVGRYTAGAVASIAFDEPAPLLDGNVKRLFARHFRIEASIDETATTNALWSLAERLVPTESPGVYNQALMELGARVCRPRNPRCEACPVATTCRARRAGVETMLPVRKAKRAVPYRHDVAAWIVQGGRTLMAKRPEGLLGGLWELPGGAVRDDDGGHETALARNLAERLGLEVEVGERLAEVDHAFTHRRVTYFLYRVRVYAGDPAPTFHTDVRWVRRGEIDALALPIAMQRLLAQLDQPRLPFE